MKPYYLVTSLTIASLLIACTLSPNARQAVISNAANIPTNISGANVQRATLRADNSTPQNLSFQNLVSPQVTEQVSNVPSDQSNQIRTLDFVTETPAAGQIKMPSNGRFQLITITGSNFQILDNDATDGVAKIQVAGPIIDLYLRPESSNTTMPATCPTPAPITDTGSQLLDRIDQAVIAKANELNAAGKSQCVYLPPISQRQNANCNSTSSGFQCSGALNKTINSEGCAEIAIYGGAMNINNALNSSKIFAAIQNNLTINQSVRGIFSSRGDLNTNLNNSSQLVGVFIGARSNNLNAGGNAKIQGLYSILNNGSLSMNMNPSAIFEGELCTTGTANLNRNGNSQLIYNPNQVTPWKSDLPLLDGMTCTAGNKPYTQTIAYSCPTPPPISNGSIQVEDTLYYVNQKLFPMAEGSWHKMPGRPIPIPDDWHSQDHNQYILKFSNAGLPQLSTRWMVGPQIKFPSGIGEIGADGGNIELPGVGRLVIPAQAISTKKTIVLKQIYDAFELIKYNDLTDSYKRSYDYISPIVSIEPLGLDLNKPAQIFLETNLQRLGNNSPGLVRWATNPTLPIDGFYHVDTQTDGLSRDQWTANMPAAIKKFAYYFKLFPADITPERGVEIHTPILETPTFDGDDNDQNNFRIQANGNNQIFNDYCPLCEIGTINPNSYNSKLKNLYDRKRVKVLNQLYAAYLIYLNTAKSHPPLWDNNTIDVIFEPCYGGYTEIDNNTRGSVMIHIGLGAPKGWPNTCDGVKTPDPDPELSIFNDLPPHEMWHAFQLSNFSKDDVDFHGKYMRWIWEAGASYVGGVLAYKNPLLFRVGPDFTNNIYFDKHLEDAFDYMGVSLMAKRNTQDDPYNGSAFFTYLSHPNTGITQKILSQNPDFPVHHAELAFVAHFSDALNAQAASRDPQIELKMLNLDLKIIHKSLRDNNFLGEYFLQHVPHSFSGDRYSSALWNNLNVLHSSKSANGFSNLTMPVNARKTIPRILQEYSSCLAVHNHKFIAASNQNLWRDQGGRPLIIDMTPPSPSSDFIRTYVFYHLTNGQFISVVLPTVSSTGKKWRTHAPNGTDAVYISVANGEWQACSKSIDYQSPKIDYVYKDQVKIYYDYELALLDSRAATREEEYALSLTVGANIVFKSTGVSKNDNIIFESKAEGAISVKPSFVSNADPNTGEQDVFVEYPQDAREHGWAKVASENDESDILNGVATPCWSIVADGSSFDIAGLKNKPCGKGG